MANVPANVQRPRCFLDINIGEQPAGRLTIELFADKTPRTCENFRQLCTGEHNGMSFQQVPFHRVIDEFMIQGGDIANGDGTGMQSIYDGEFDDENLDWREMDAAGFFVTLEPCPHLNGKHTIFGRLVSGQDVLEKIAEVDVDKGDRPLEPVLVAKCGELERKKKKTEAQPQPPTQSISGDRGRRRKSNQSDEDMADSPEPPKPRNRRQSDHEVDEGLRGRPRARSGSRSDSNALSTTGEEEGNEDSQSPVLKHKRKRSKSPSRHVDRREEHAGEKREAEDPREFERRRRSLPNQYGDDRYKRDYGGDDNRYRPSPRRGGEDYAGRRQDDRYRPSRDRRGYQQQDEGRLGDGGRLGGGGEGHDDHEPQVKFKGRGVMKYREPGRL
ncbi:hypothetical protein LTR78_001657 [Recurvomyces mirabilis]|uniref:peptidylprolyl isomerase n=1 Tax=Recurvomyces mirabilis TaxID=574656 RepID=A0AAE0WUD9_9PEZI|nr:hypothetical protein LTR78_001657 [Recurvomyces mirabilis]KAK5151773.1 hypothetical protein LTS14_008905 [Recurvomyces mirabilis]